jgi:FkbM family methyltransferase
MQLLSNIIKKIASMCGLEIKKIKKMPPLSEQKKNRLFNANIPDEGSVIPRANFETISIIMNLLAETSQGAVVIQVGANDGTTSDSIYKFIKSGKFASFHIEPIPSTYSRLREFYDDVNSAHTINAAISDKSGVVDIYSVKDEGRWHGDLWATQLASFDLNHLLRHGIDEDEIEIVKVPSLTFEDFISEHSVTSIDVLLVDVEGYDAEIVSMALESGLRPKCIYFENVQFVRRLNQSKVDQFYSLLDKSGYAWSHDRINTLALHSSFISSGTPAVPGTIK